MADDLNTIITTLKYERNELRKYIIDICKLLGIDTRQSLLGGNCLEFYAVLSSTAENKIKELKKWQEANQPTGICETCTVKSVEDMYKYKLALDEIEEFCTVYSDNHDTYETVYKFILAIISKAKDSEQ